MKILKILCIALCILPLAACTSNNDFESTSEPNESGISEEDLYFPPLNSDFWATTALEDIGWNTTMEEPLYDFLEAHNTDAFIILKDGRIVIERYFNQTTINSSNPWYSVGKSLTAFMVGIAQEEGFLTTSESSSLYLGEGWTKAPTDIENSITIAHHISMTTGLDYSVNNTNCTDPECLDFLNPSGTFWYYHNAGYTLTQDIIANATNSDFTSYFEAKLKSAIGMKGIWVSLGFASVYYSDARSMARFGLLNLNRGSWENIPVLNDVNYFNAMTSPSQNLNKAYGYLWWLNGEESYRVPASEQEFNGPLIPNAPADLVAGLGKNDQKLYVVPSEGLVIVRMGDNAGESLLGPSSFDNLLWEQLNDLMN